MFDRLERANRAAELHTNLRVLDGLLEHHLSAPDLLGSEADGNEIESLPYEKAPTPRERPSTADVEREDVERARRYRLAYERDHVDRPAAVDGNLTPFPINRYFPMPPAAEYAPDHKY